MEKCIYIIKSVATEKGQTVRVDNVFAVSTEDEAIKTVNRLNSKHLVETKFDNFENYFIYERIKLYD